MKRVKIGGLDCIEISGESSSKVCVVLLHGYGSSSDDLAPLSRINSKVRWIFPQAPNEIQFSPSYTGYGWFPVDVMKMQEAVSQGKFEVIEHALEKGLDQASEKLEKFLKELDMPLENIILGGFSQGAVVSIDTALRLPEQIRGLIILSGTLTHAKIWEKRAKLKPKLPFFMSHGKHDDVLPYELACKLDTLLQKCGLAGKMTSFNGGHEVPYSLLLELQPFLETVIAN